MDVMEGFRMTDDEAKDEEVTDLKSAPPSNDIWTVKSFKKKFSVKIIKYDNQEMEFDLIGIYPGLINAFRRLLISEVPTMAIEKVTVHQNKTVMQDEILAHRLGLIPLKANPRLFQFRMEGDTVGTDTDTLEFELNVKCVKNPHCRVGHYRPEDMYLDYHILSKDIKWRPMGGQSSMHKEEDIGPVHNDIVIVKMRPGHELHVTMTAVKGIGKDHAKFSPVGTASYRLHPHIELLEEIEGPCAERLKSYFSPGVIEIVDIKGKLVATVSNARIDMCSRNILNDKDLSKKVVIGRRKDHYIFTIESVIKLPPDELFKEAVKILKKKCSDALAELKKIEAKK
ncbi:hypothetical protein O3M35_002094 [Rhynocoris fuscipes]|uniref:DNA-directed RNA polymerases I and III subunit RPAC1 n=1 Tax=Rhynocoris fuscipes TaxID=488301 RepID=A0AAW1CRJ2_9HEMI